MSDTRLNELTKEDAWLAFSTMFRDYTREKFEADWLEFIAMKVAHERSKAAN